MCIDIDIDVSMGIFNIEILRYENRILDLILRIITRMW